LEIAHLCIFRVAVTVLRFAQIGGKNLISLKEIPQTISTSNPPNWYFYSKIWGWI